MPLFKIDDISLINTDKVITAIAELITPDPDDKNPIYEVKIHLEEKRVFKINNLSEQAAKETIDEILNADAQKDINTPVKDIPETLKHEAINRIVNSTKYPSTHNYCLYKQAGDYFHSSCRQTPFNKYKNSLIANGQPCQECGKPMLLVSTQA